MLKRGEFKLEPKKKMVSDSLWSISGLVLVNVALQFAVYPFWERQAGEAALGNYLYLISLMNVFAMSIGVSAGYARLKKSAVGVTHNTPYLVILGLTTFLSAAVGVLISFFAGVKMSVPETVTFAALVCVVMWRYYVEVDFKLSLKYKSYFGYHLCISAGYAVGILLFFLTGIWPLTMLVGELTSVAYVVLRGNVMRPDVSFNAEETKETFKLVCILLGAEMLSTLIFNADRILLKTVINEIAVTEFYLASLIGKTVALLTAPLTGVIVGYLSKYKGDLKLKGMNIITVIALGVIMLATVACTVGSYILIPILYPDQMATVKQYFVTANLSQIIYFVGSVITVVLLFFSKSKYQIYITAVYALTFVALCIPFARLYGLSGFCIGLILTCTARLLVTLMLGYFTALKNKKR